MRRRKPTIFFSIILLMERVQTGAEIERKKAIPKVLRSAISEEGTSEVESRRSMIG